MLAMFIYYQCQVAITSGRMVKKKKTKVSNKSSGTFAQNHAFCLQV